jgi:hypothetical protein
MNIGLPNGLFACNLNICLPDQHLLAYTVKTPDVEFRTYNWMLQDQTVHGAEYVSGLWAG